MDELKEVLDALQEDIHILNEDDFKKVHHNFLHSFSFLYSGINWKDYPNHNVPCDYESILSNTKQKKCYIIWSDGSLPILISNIELVLQNYDEIATVTFETWIVSIDFDWILEEKTGRGTTFSTIES